MEAEPAKIRRRASEFLIRFSFTRKDKSKNSFRFNGFDLTCTTMWDIKRRHKEAGYRKASGGVPAFPYFLVLLVYAYIFRIAVSTKRST
jgi:hypothetical protein